MSDAVAPPETSVRSRLRKWQLPGWMRDERAITGVILIVILLVAFAVRIYRVPELMVVGGDQARDAQVVMHMLNTGEPVLQGPIASTGTYHRGPAYYYLLGAAYWLSGGDPVGGYVLSVVMDLAALVMVFVLARCVAGNAAGLVAASLYAVAPIIVFFARFQWNPQNMLFFGLLAVYAAMRVARGDGRWLLVLAPSWLIAWQFHEQSYLLVPMLGLVLLWKWRVWLKPRIVIGASALSLVVMLPFIVQQLQTRFADVRAILAYFRAAATGAEVPTTTEPGIPSVVDRVTHALTWLQRALPGPAVVDLVLIALGLVGLAWLINRAVKERSPEAVVLLLYCATPLMFAFWPAPIYSHYQLIDYPILLILAGVGFAASARAVRQLAADRPRMADLAVASGGAAIALVVAVSVVGTMTAQAAVQPSAQRWTNFMTIARQVIADAAGQPFALRFQVDYHPYAKWYPELEYPFEFAGTPADPLRVDLPTYVIFDPPDLAGGASFGGHVVDGVRWVAFPPPTLGPQLLSDVWQLGGTGGSAELITTALPATIHLTNSDTSLYSEALQTVPIAESTRYLVRYEFRTEASAGFVTIGLLVADASGQLLTILPVDGRAVHSARSEATLASFIGEAPAGAVTGTLVLRWRGSGEAWFSKVELRRVESEPPW